ncbi:MAG: hypothetical protein BGO51_15845 [Rhodospirillales bacterium 69-11]|nr:MAG: hypothetical protein BGO51_15845 [Rhodospirillales bacterium 69-11]
MLKTGAAFMLAASLAFPAMAQTSGHGSAATGTPATSGSPSTAATGSTSGGPASRNPIMTDDGGMRTSKIVGSSVYNDKDEKVGSIDDLIIGSDKSLHAVISVGGFLGMGAKMVEVPFDKLQFGNTKNNSDNRVVMPGATKESLNSMPDYHYVKQG